MAEPAAPRAFGGQFAVIGIFALGIVFGVALSLVLVHHVIPPRRFGPHRDGPVPIERMTRDLGLDADQQVKIRAIFQGGMRRCAASSTNEPRGSSGASTRAAREIRSPPSAIAVPRRAAAGRAAAG
jgi:hypothetical protein